MGTQNPRKRKKTTTQTAKKPRPGASSPCTAQHTRIRPTARRDRHRLHHRGRERNRRRRSQHHAHAREGRGRAGGSPRRFILFFLLAKKRTKTFYFSSCCEADDNGSKCMDRGWHLARTLLLFLVLLISSSLVLGTETTSSSCPSAPRPSMHRVHVDWQAMATHEGWPWENDRKAALRDAKRFADSKLARAHPRSFLDGELPQREGPPPVTMDGIPHAQLSEQTSPALLDQLKEEAIDLMKVPPATPQIGCHSSRKLPCTP